MSETVGCQIQTLGCSFRKPRACSRSRSVWLEPRVRPSWSISSVEKRPSAAMMPRWKFGMLSSSPDGMKKGCIGVQVWTSTSRVTRSAAVATARLSPGVDVARLELRIVVDVFDDQRAHRIVEDQHHQQRRARPSPTPAARPPAGGRHAPQTRHDRLAPVPGPAPPRRPGRRRARRGRDRRSWPHLTIRLVTKQGRGLLECSVSSSNGVAEWRSIPNPSGSSI